jgi:hypothetical protein
MYASLILYYNMIYFRSEDERKDVIEIESIQKFVDIVTENVIQEFGDDTLISRVLLDFIALLTKETDTTNIILSNEILIDYCFRKLMNPLVAHMIYENPYSSREGKFSQAPK